MPPSTPQRRDTWRQASPYEQLVVVLMGIEGFLYLREEGSVTDEKFLKEMLERHEDLRALRPFLKHSDTWETPDGG